MNQSPLQTNSSSCNPPTRKDYLLWFANITVLGGTGLYLICPSEILPHSLNVFLHAEYALLKQMSVGLLVGIVSVGLLSYVPREVVMRFFGPSHSWKSLLRATVAGVFLDMCSHGILMVGMKLYERGVSLGQVMAFLIASPWNSFSLSIILVTLIGWQWTLCFIMLSVLLALVSGFVFDILVKNNVLPHNPYSHSTPNETNLEAPGWTKTDLLQLHFWFSVLKNGFQGATTIIKWTFIGIVVASLMRTFVDPHLFSHYFGPTLLGLSLTLTVATVVEVCSEGSTPIAAEFMKQAPGNTYAFLMAGVSTDYTEIMMIKETSKSWKIAMFLPFVTLPQIFITAWLINYFGGPAL